MKKTGKPAKQTQKISNSFILFVGDEGAILLHLQNKKVAKRIFAASPEPDHVRSMDEQLKSQPKAPLIVLVDMMDQSYVRQTLPPVSSFNVGKIIRRRLNKDFSADDIKGYIVFGREKKGRRDWNYLMASLASTPVLQKWIDFAVERSNPFRGIGLVPLESQSLLQALEAVQLTKAGADAKPTDWNILISHHKVGGFRQIVLRNGQLVFTRLAQFVGEPTPEVIAGNIEQEMLNTLEYLKRLGLQDTTGLTVSIIASKEIKDCFEPRTVPPNRCHFYTPYEAAMQLSLDDIAKPEDHFGDVVIAGFIGRKRKLLLTLYTAYTRKLANLSRYNLFLRIGASIAIVGALAWAGLTFTDLLSTQDQIESLKAERASLNSQFSVEQKKKETLPERINLFTDISSLFKHFAQPAYDPLYFAHRLRGAVGERGLLKAYRWSVIPAVSSFKDEAKRQVSVEFDVTLTTPQTPREEFVASAQKLVEDIKKTFPEYDVTNSDLPGVLSDTKELKTVITDNAGPVSTQSEALNTSIHFNMRGPLNKPLQPTPAVR